MLHFIALNPSIRFDQAVMPRDEGAGPLLGGGGSGQSYDVDSEDDDRAELGLWR